MTRSAWFLVTLALLLLAPTARAQERPRWQWPHELREAVTPDQAPATTLRRHRFTWVRSLGEDEGEREVLDVARLPDGRVALLMRGGVCLVPDTLEGPGTMLALPEGCEQVELAALLGVVRGPDGVHLHSLERPGLPIALPGASHALALGRLDDGAVVCAGLPGPAEPLVSLHVVRRGQVRSARLDALLALPAGTLVLPLQLLPEGKALLGSWPEGAPSALHLVDLDAMKPLWTATPGGVVCGATAGPERVICATADGLDARRLLDAWSLSGGALGASGDALHALSRADGHTLWSRAGGEMTTHLAAAGPVDVLMDGLDDWIAGVDAAGEERWRVEHGMLPTDPEVLAEEADGELLLMNGSFDHGVRFDPRTGRQSGVVEVQDDGRGGTNASQRLLRVGDLVLVRLRGQVMRRDVEPVEVEVYIPEGEQRIEDGATISPDFEDALPALVRALASADVRVRRAAALNAARWDRALDEGVVALAPHLAAALADEDLEVRRRATLALATVGPAARGSLERLAAGLASPDDRLRLGSAVAIAAIDSASPAAGEAGDVLLAALARGRAEERQLVLRSLAQLPAHQETVASELRAALAREDPTEVEAALMDLSDVACGSSPQPGVAGRLVPDVARLLREHPAPRVREAAAGALLTVGPAAASARPALRAALADPEQRVADRAFSTLCWIGPEAQDLELVRERFASDDWTTRRAAAEGLKQLGAPGIETLTRALRAGPPARRATAIDALEWCDPALAAPAVPALREVARGTDAEAAAAAARALERLEQR